MKKKNLLLCLCAFTMSGIFSSCDDNADDAKYRSLPPEFSDMEFKVLDGGSTTIKAGDQFVATCVQSKKGRLLNLTKYNWTANTEDATHKYKKELKAGYDNESENPTDTVVFKNPGVYQMKFTGRFYTSGNYEVVSKIVDIDGGKITYKTPSFQFYDVIIEKRVVVK